MLSIFGAFETVITALSDQWPALRPHKPKVIFDKNAFYQPEGVKTILKVVAVTSLAMLVLGLPFTCHGGIHMFNVFNESVNILMGIALNEKMDNVIQLEYDN